MKNKALYLGLIIAVLLVVAGCSQKDNSLGGTTASDWNVGGDLNVGGDAVIDGSLSSRNELVSLTGTTTLTADTSGTTYLLSGVSHLITLPAVADGVNYKFVINGASTGTNFIVDSAEGDNIEGTLIVAGAVVDCASVDQINFVVDGENVGDYFEIYSDGTQWLLGDSGALTASKLTCTDPS